jgi:formylglycine-generating enzyme required for sulfatase activity
MMGSPESDQDRKEDETWHTRRIPRIFCIANKETTREQYRAFLSENPGLRRQVADAGAIPSGTPQTSVGWYEAAAYCNWLSRIERIPESEWCYERPAGRQYAEGMQLAEDWANRRGYRLATEPEWEYACRAKATTAWFFGSSKAYLGRYAVFDETTGDGPLPTGRRKPNDFGLFDMLGNAQEWCQDVYSPTPLVGASQSAAAPPNELTVRNSDQRVLRGGSYRDVPADMRCAARHKAHPYVRVETIGFRVARTFFPPSRNAPGR